MFSVPSHALSLAHNLNPSHSMCNTRRRRSHHVECSMPQLLSHSHNHCRSHNICHNSTTNHRWVRHRQDSRFLVLSEPPMYSTHHCSVPLARNRITRKRRASAMVPRMCGFPDPFTPCPPPHQLRAVPGLRDSWLPPPVDVRCWNPWASANPRDPALVLSSSSRASSHNRGHRLVVVEAVDPDCSIS